MPAINQSSMYDFEDISSTGTTNTHQVIEGGSQGNQQQATNSVQDRLTEGVNASSSSQLDPETVSINYCLNMFLRTSRI